MKRSSLKFELNRLVWVLVAAVGLYSVAMMSIRLAMTNMAYEFESLKAEERDLREENQRLRAQISKQLSADRFRLEGFRDPTPEQIKVLPQ